MDEIVNVYNDSEFVVESSVLLLQSNIESQQIQIENLPIDFVSTGSEMVQTFIVQEDGLLVPVEVEDDAQLNSSIAEKILTRKRKRNPSKWKSNVSKVNRQSGKTYTDQNGKTKRARFVKDIGCSNPAQCPLKCMKKIDMEGRQAICDSYWALNDSEKRHFYAANIKRVPCQRKRTKAEVSHKSYTLNYYFNYTNIDVRVCQQFFVNTLDVNKGRVYYFFNQSKNRSTATPGPQKHGKHTKKVLSEMRKQEVRDHINKFPAVESHYCREGSKRKYLDQGLNLSRMYEMYVTETENPVKESAYRNIFNYEFNLSFFRPKKDRCEKCIGFPLINAPTEEETNNYSFHIEKKTNAHNERNTDRNIVAEGNKIGVIPFDLQNVFQLPIANASNLFYLRKFSVYNLTMMFNKTVYNVMWNELCCGREGTHLASAVIKALKQIVLDNPQLEHLILWSDSCVPQNRNSFMSAAIQEFLNSDFSGNVQRIDQKYSEAGHGEVQEVDNVHSVIEKFLQHKFIYSPVSLIEEILKIPNGKLTFKLLQMNEDDYFDYQSLALAWKYSVIPYTKVVQLTYKRNNSEISFKTNYGEDFNSTDILLKKSYVTPPELHQLKLHSDISNSKISDLKKMFGIMPEIDRNFYETEFKKLLQKRQSLESEAHTTNINNETALKSVKSRAKTVLKIDPKLEKTSISSVNTTASGSPQDQPNFQKVGNGKQATLKQSESGTNKIPKCEKTSTTSVNTIASCSPQDQPKLRNTGSGKQAEIALKQPKPKTNKALKHAKKSTSSVNTISGDSSQEQPKVRNISSGKQAEAAQQSAPNKAPKHEKTSTTSMNTIASGSPQHQPEVRKTGSGRQAEIAVKPSKQKTKKAPKHEKISTTSVNAITSGSPVEQPKVRNICSGKQAEAAQQSAPNKAPKHEKTSTTSMNTIASGSPQHQPEVRKTGSGRQAEIAVKPSKQKTKKAPKHEKISTTSVNAITSGSPVEQPKVRNICSGKQAEAAQQSAPNKAPKHEKTSTTSMNTIASGSPQHQPEVRKTGSGRQAEIAVKPSKQKTKKAPKHEKISTTSVNAITSGSPVEQPKVRNICSGKQAEAAQQSAPNKAPKHEKTSTTSMNTIASGSPQHQPEVRKAGSGRQAEIAVKPSKQKTKKAPKHEKISTTSVNAITSGSPVEQPKVRNICSGKQAEAAQQSAPNKAPKHEKTSTTSMNTIASGYLQHQPKVRNIGSGEQDNLKQSKSDTADCSKCKKVEMCQHLPSACQHEF